MHEIVGGNLIIDPLLDSTRTHKLEQLILLPDATRELTVTDEFRSIPDRLDANVELAYRSTEKSADEGAAEAGDAKLYVLPWWIFVVCGAIVGLVILRSRSRRHREGDDLDFDELSSE
jgi:hypothetical protein